MSDDKTTTPAGEEPEVSEQDLEADEGLRSLLRRAATHEDEAAPAAPDLLPAVQRKIRQRSRGKFFADGWSTTQARVNYVLVALVMLLVIGVAYVALGPTGFSH